MKTHMSKIANIVAAVLVLAVLVLSFMPYWHYNGTETVTNDAGKKVKVTVEKDASINGYLWTIDNHKELSKIFENQIVKADYDTNNLLGAPLAMLILGVIALIMILKKFETIIGSCVATAFGIVGVAGFLSNGVGGIILRSGNTWNMWYIHVALCAVIAVAGIVAFIFNIPEFVKVLKGRY